MMQWNGPQVMDAVSHRIDQQAHLIGREFVAVAQNYVHVRTGFLRSTIGYAYDDVTHTISFIVGAPYGVFVEYGTRYTSPHPYIRPALNTIDTIWGFRTEMVFANAIPTDMELLARGPGFIGGRVLTVGQKRHVKYNLKPTSERHHVGNVSRAAMHVRKRAF